MAKNIFVLRVICQMFLQIVVILVTVFQTAQTSIALLKNIGLERGETFDQDPLSDIELPFAVQ